MRWAISLPLFLTLPLAAPALASTKIQMDTVPREYTPTAGAELPEPVSVQDFYFEVNQETARARVVVEYTYPDMPVYGLEGGLGPRPTLAQLPGLTYDPLAHAVVYDGAGKRTVCAIVRERKSRFGRHLRIRNTGSCVVTATATDHAEDDGWTIQRFRAIDTYFEVH